MNNTELKPNFLYPELLRNDSEQPSFDRFTDVDYKTILQYRVIEECCWLRPLPNSVFGLKRIPKDAGITDWASAEIKPGGNEFEFTNTFDRNNSFERTETRLILAACPY